jgi:hypothetical protein
VNPFSDARTDLVTAYIAAGLTAFGYTPATLVPPTIVVEPDRGWIVPNRLSPKISAGLRLLVTIYVPLIDSSAAIGQMEELVASVLRSTPDGFAILSVEAPRPDTPSNSQGTVLACEISLTAQVKE